MNKRYFSKHLRIIMVTALCCCLGGCGSYIPQETENVDIEAISSNATSAITIDPYENCYASNHVRIASEIDEYDAAGALIAKQVNERTDSLTLGLSGIDSVMSDIRYLVSADGTETEYTADTYTYNDDKKIQGIKRLTYNSDGDIEDYQNTEYTYTGSGQLHTATVQTYKNEEKTKIGISSVTTYFYDDDGNCVKSVIYDSASNITQTTTYVLNTNGSVVKEKTYDSDKNILQVVNNAYNRDGTMGYSEVIGADGTISSKQYYEYDKHGYLIKISLFAINDDTGNLDPSAAYIYHYFGNR